MRTHNKGKKLLKKKHSHAKGKLNYRNQTKQKKKLQSKQQFG